MKKVQIMSLILLFAVALVACQSAGTPSSSQPANYAVQLPNSEAFVGIAITGQDIVAYVCDGTDTSTATVSEWFKGSLSGNSFDLTSNSGARLSGTLSTGAIEGAFSLANGESLAFRASQVGNEAGLFRSEETFDGNNYVAGWIILADGQQRGSIIRLGTLAFTPVPIPRLPRNLQVTTTLGTFNAFRVGSP